MYLVIWILSQRLDKHKSFRKDLEYLDIPAWMKRSIAARLKVIWKVKEMLDYYYKIEFECVVNQTEKWQNFAGEKFTFHLFSTMTLVFRFSLHFLWLLGIFFNVAWYLTYLLLLILILALTVFWLEVDLREVFVDKQFLENLVDQLKIKLTARRKRHIRKTAKEYLLEYNDVCPLCLEQHKDRREYVVTDCCHVYGCGCYEPWWRVSIMNLVAGGLIFLF